MRKLSAENPAHAELFFQHRNDLFCYPCAIGPAVYEGVPDLAIGNGIGVQCFDLHALSAWVDEGEEADGLAVFEVLAEGGVSVDAFDLGFVQFDDGGIRWSESKPRELSMDDMW
jgi:hypothetical protein